MGDADGDCDGKCKGFGICTDDEAMASGLAEASFFCNEGGVKVEPINRLRSRGGSADMMMSLVSFSGSASGAPKRRRLSSGVPRWEGPMG